MNDAKKERLSAFVDDEAEGSTRELAGELLADPELLGVWSRYHLISDCLKRNMPEHLDKELAGRVAKSLEREPAIVAPARIPAAFIKPVTGFAIAASVATLAIVGIQQQQANAPHEIEVSGNTFGETLVPGSVGGGSAVAPARRVSSGNGNASRECQTLQNGRQARVEPVEDDGLEEDCR